MAILQPNLHVRSSDDQWLTDFEISSSDLNPFRLNNGHVVSNNINPLPVKKSLQSFGIIVDSVAPNLGTIKGQGYACGSNDTRRNRSSKE